MPRSELIDIHRADKKVAKESLKMRPQDYVNNKFEEFQRLAALLSIVAGLPPTLESNCDALLSDLSEEKLAEYEQTLSREMDERLGRLSMAFERIQLFRRKF